MVFVLTEKRLRALRRLMKSDGVAVDEINRVLAHRDTAFSAYKRYYVNLTKADRDRLFATAAKSPTVPKFTPSAPKETAKAAKPGRGPGKVPAGESFTLVVPADLLAQYRDLAKSEQRPVAQLIRLAMRHYLSK